MFGGYVLEAFGAARGKDQTRPFPGGAVRGGPADAVGGAGVNDDVPGR
jgi:hypothetical protein